MLPTTLRSALLSAAVLLPAHVLADDDDVVTFQFSACVSTCLGKTGYSMDGEDNQKEMCKASREGLLEAIIACTVSNCLEDLAAVESTLLQPMQTGCKELEKPVSDDEIEDAASAAADIQFTLAISTSTASSSSTEPAATTPTTPDFQPLEVEIGTSITPMTPTPVPAETPTAIEPVAETTTTSPAPTIVTEATVYQPESEVPAETQTSTSDLSVPSETQSPLESITSAEASSTFAAAIVPVAQPTDTSYVQPAAEATTAAEPPSDPAPSPPPASEPTSTAAGDHANQNQPEIASETTVVKPSSTANANAQAQPTTAAEQSPADVPAAHATSSAGSSKTEGSGPKATHASASDGDDHEDDNDDGSSPGATPTATPDTSGELVLATGTPTASSATGFATSVTAVAATPSASGTQTASLGDVDGGLGGGSPFSVVMASAALAVAPCWWVPLTAAFGAVVSLMML